MDRSSVRVFFARLIGLFTRRRGAARLQDEIQAHLDALIEQYQAAGMSAEDAHLAARRAFGAVDRIRILHREQRSLPAVEWLFFDVKTALRVVARDRAFTAGVILVLALGLAVNTTIFTIVNGMTWRTLPVEHGEEIVQISSQQLPRRVGTYTSFADFQDWRAAAQTFEDMAAYRTATMNLGDDSRPADRLAGTYVTSNTFRLLRVQPVLGRDFSAEDDAPGATAVIMLGHHVWAARYAADPSIVGQTIRINGIPTTVVGVMPDGFQFPLRADVWRPASQMPTLDTANRGQRQLDIVARLRDGVTVEAAGVELEAITAALASQFPDTNKNVGARVILFTHAFVQPPPEAREPLIMMIAAAIVLLIACANGANLLLARSAQRAREMAMRATLGASRLRIVRQLLIEALLITLAAGALGLLFSRAGVSGFVTETTDMGLPYWIAFEFDTRVFAYVAIAVLGTAVAFGLAPAWHLSKTDAHDVLKDGARGTIGGRRAQRWTGALLVSELALTLTLLGSAAILLRSAAALGRYDAQLDLDDLFAAQIGLPAARYDTPEKRRSLHAALQERLDDAEGLPSATLASVRPFVESSTLRLEVEGQAVAEDRIPAVQVVGAGKHYFQTLGIRLLRGRELRPEDAAPGRKGIVVNERFAQVHFPNIDPTGQRVRLTESPDDTPTTDGWFTIVGVSPSIRQRTMASVAPLVYVPLDLFPGPVLGVIARSGGDLRRAAAALRDEVRAVDPDVAAHDIRSLRRLSELSRWPARAVSFVLGLFAVIASVLSIAGLYGLTTYGVAQRTAEIGLRTALGARRSQIAWFFLRATLIHAAIGLVIGLGGVLAVGQLISGVLRETAGADAIVLGGIIGALALITAVACFVPTRRALRLDPAVALRHE